MPDRWRKIALAALAAQLPFDLRYTLLGLTNLQWTFLLAVVVCAPVLIKERRHLLQSRVIQAAIVFVAIQWVTALLAPEFNTNAAKGAVRFSAGLMLAAVAFLQDRAIVFRTWSIAAGVAAAYALVDYAGFGAPRLFREGEFYIGQVRRLSGSFEYPNTAAAYFAMSLPIAWWTNSKPVVKWMSAFFIWCAVILTFSKGGLAAAFIVVSGAAILSRSRSAASLALLGPVAYAVLLPVNPYLVERLWGPTVHNPIAAEYRTPWNQLTQTPGAHDQVPLQIRNTGISKWRAGGLWRVSISYRWWNRDKQSFVRNRTPLITRLPKDVERGETVDVPAAFQTPDEPGHYFLVFELFSRNFDWFSQTGVVPTLIDADIRAAKTRSVGQTDLSAIYRGNPTPNALTASIPRSSLWNSALRMFLSHPLGVGPDNFRLQYGKYLGADRWDTNIYSNNLYLELLTGSGLLGLAAFGLILFFIPWRTDAVFLGMATFLIHGVVDVFLMTTPIYFSFWLLVGFGLQRDQPPSSRSG